MLRLRRFFSIYNRKVRKGNFFKLVTVRFGKQVSEVQKKIKKNRWFEVLIWVKKLKKFLMQACAIGGNFFRLLPKQAQREVRQVGRKQV